MNERPQHEGLALYEVVIVDNKEYVRKDLYDQLRAIFDSVCDSHTEFVNKVHAAVSGLARKRSG